MLLSSQAISDGIHAPRDRGYPLAYRYASYQCAEFADEEEDDYDRYYGEGEDDYHRPGYRGIRSCYTDFDNDDDEGEDDYGDDDLYDSSYQPRLDHWNGHE